jgi:ferrous iron transport protein B
MERNNLNNNRETILSTANNLRWEVGEDLHDTLMESIYSNAAALTKKSVLLPAELLTEH